MKKSIKKLIALVLCLAMIICVSATGASATDKITDCDENCQYYPTIIVPGLGQSPCWILDENGDYVYDKDDNKIASFPPFFDVEKILVRVIVPALLSIIFQRDIGLSEAVGDIIDMTFEVNKGDNDGNLLGNIETEKYPYPLSECSEYEQSVVYHHVPFNLYENDQPLDHMYYFTYNSLGNHIETVEELYDFVQMVKAQSGHDKVNLVPLSQGASLVSAMVDYYPQIKNELHKIIFVVPAIDGSTIIGDVFNGRVSFLNKEYVYNGFLGELGLMDKGTASLIEIALRILPDDVVMGCLEAACKSLVETVMIKSTNMWALCPSGDYESAAEKYLSDPELKNIKAQTDKYYGAQLRAHSNIRNLMANGVQVFCIAEYDYNLINVGESWNSENGDFIIQLDSTSMGAYAAKPGETLPENYVQQNTVCKNPNHNHISPDRVVDASTGLLPDTTFYFDNQRHDLTARNDVILKLALNLIECDDIQDVYSDPRFPQFNIGRSSEQLMLLVEQANTIDVSTLSAEDAAELKAAVAEAERVIDSTIGVVGEVEKTEARLSACLIKAGLLEAPEEAVSLDIFTKVSPVLYQLFGTDGYSQIAVKIIAKVIKGVTDIVLKLI